MTGVFLNKIRRFIDDQNLLDADKPVIVGLSGGPDSVCLLSVLRALGFKCIAASCNFHLRGDESDRDTRHAKSIAEALGCKFIKIDFDVEEYRRNNRGRSVEMACRELRYEWFDKLKNKFGAQAIAVGHNADDNIETILFNLQRGTGISGLKGIPPKNDNGVIRPLICVSREEIMAYLARVGLDYVTDSSNLENNYNRNKIRNTLLPVFEELFPNVRKGITLTSCRLSESEGFYRQSIEGKRRVYQLSDGSIDLKTLAESEPNAGLLLYEWLSPKGFSRTQTDDMIASSDSSGAVFRSSSETWINNRGIIAPMRDFTIPHDLESIFSFDVQDAKFFNPTHDRNTAYFDAAILDGDRLTFRYWEKGDRIKPYGMKGSKKVSDIFNDMKIPVARKSSVPMIVKGNEILWIAGIRASSLYPVTPLSDRFVTVRYLRPEE